jgi:hypothetical protein
MGIYHSINSLYAQLMPIIPINVESIARAAVGAKTPPKASDT